ncbi:MAG TPA: zf-HC2 domain-containing protein [Solirubrobacteraceae bacterium]|nr:zf-HC2 domain-containing protein [Solirubrobacteraceae bacterium]
MRLGLKPPPISCQEVVELVTAYLDGTLSRRQRRRIDAHLADCVNCSAYLEQMRLVIGAAGALKEEDLTPEMEREFRTVFERSREAETD